MADANPRVHLGELPLTAEWQVYVAPINCSCIELTADKDWAWCSDKESGAVRAVPAFQREMVVPKVDRLIMKGEPVVWVKAEEEGTLFEKCVR